MTLINRIKMKEMDTIDEFVGKLSELSNQLPWEKISKNQNS